MSLSDHLNRGSSWIVGLEASELGARPCRRGPLPPSRPLHAQSDRSFPCLREPLFALPTCFHSSGRSPGLGLIDPSQSAPVDAGANPFGARGWRFQPASPADLGRLRYGRTSRLDRAFRCPPGQRALVNPQAVRLTAPQALRARIISLDLGDVGHTPFSRRDAVLAPAPAHVDRSTPERPNFPASWLSPSPVFDRWSVVERAELPCKRAASSAAPIANCQCRKVGLMRAVGDGLSVKPSIWARTSFISLGSNGFATMAAQRYSTGISTAWPL